MLDYLHHFMHEFITISNDNSFIDFFLSQYQPVVDVIIVIFRCFATGIVIANLYIFNRITYLWFWFTWIIFIYIHHNEFPRVKSNLSILLKTSTILTISLSVKCACHRYFDANDELSWLLFLWILKCKKSKAGKSKCKEQLNGQRENKTK